MLFFLFERSVSDILRSRMLLLGSKETARAPEVQEAYDRHRMILWEKYGDNPPCPFCDLPGRKIIEETSTLAVLENDFPYDSFENQKILRHYMIVPRRHISLFEDFTQAEQEEYWQLMATYHKKGYSSLTRSAIDVMRSVPLHLHTHLFFYLPEEA